MYSDESQKLELNSIKKEDADKEKQKSRPSRAEDTAGITGHPSHLELTRSRPLLEALLTRSEPLELTRPKMQRSKRIEITHSQGLGPER